ncbi:MAG: YidC/Oxa1 family membrane protein insertase [Clostridia bacterium]|nr:YidC/Oxa1 family membrane protein insertase [Clostridia bacterium]
MELITKPFALIMGLFYDWTGNYVVSIFLFTLLFRLIMLPFSIKQQKSSAKMARIQPKIKRIQEKYATNRVKMNEEMQKLYQKENYNPTSLSGCLPSMVQLLLIFPLIEVIYKPITYILGISTDTIKAIAEKIPEIDVAKSGFQLKLFGESVESLVSAGATPEVAEQITGFNSKFFFLDISSSPEISKPSLIWLIPIIACLLQIAVSYVSIRQQKANGQGGANQMGCMLYGMSIFSLVLCFSFPAGMGIYWISSSLIMLIQQLLINKFYGPGRIAAQLMVDETIERRAKEDAVKSKFSL